MVIAVLSFSSGPLTIGLSNSSSNPVLSNVLIVFGEIIMLLFLLQLSLMSHRSKDKNLVNRKKINALLRQYWKGDNPPKKDDDLSSSGRNGLFEKFYSIWNNYALLVITIGGFYWLLFAWAVKFIDIAIPSIMVELGVVFYVLLRYLDEKKSGKKEILSKSIWFLFIFAVLGVIYITLSHTSINQTFSYTGLFLSMVILLIIGARIERALKWAELMTEKWQGGQKSKVKRIFLLLGQIIGSSLTLFILLILGSISWILQGSVWDLSFAPISILLLTNEVTISTTVSWVICIAGGIISAIGIWSFRESNSITDTLDINGIYYLTPVLGIVWLLPFGLVQLQRWDYFVVGALIILATSILIAVETDTRRLGFRGLILSLWSTGLLIYFREKWIQWPWLADGTPWEWNIETVDYYSLIVLSATIFILIFSFRINRLIERTNSEEAQFLRMRHKIRNLNSYQNQGSCRQGYFEDLIEDLNDLDQFNTKTGGRFMISLAKLRLYILPDNTSDTDNSLSDSSLNDIKQLSELELEFTLLYRSKQRGRYFAENLVLYIFALVTIMVTIGTRPVAISHWNALMIDTLAFLFSAAICFTTINLIDLRLYRERSTLELIDTEGGNEKDKEAINQKAVQIISIILTVVISISFVVLLYDKWMGIWFL